MLCFDVLIKSAYSNLTNLTTHSTIFDTELRLEIGRYELTSSGSSDGFFSRGRTMVCFKAFTISPRAPASSGIRRFTSVVGAGSNEHYFAGARPTIYVISSAVVSRNTDRQIVLSVSDHSRGSPEVDAQDCIYFGRV